MHYKNGRKAQEGDPVVYKQPYTGRVMAGNIVDINPGQESCNGVLMRAAAPPLQCITVSDCYHAEDAYQAMEPKGPADSRSPIVNSQ